MVPLDTELPSEVSDMMEIVTSWATAIIALLCVLAIIICGGMMIMAQRRGEGGEHTARLGWIMAGAVLVGAAAGFAGILTGSWA